MSTAAPAQSATIIQFPRSAMRGARPTAGVDGKSWTGREPRPAVAIEWGSSWYHDAAIAEEKTPHA